MFQWEINSQPRESAPPQKRGEAERWDLRSNKDDWCVSQCLSVVVMGEAWPVSRRLTSGHTLLSSLHTLSLISPGHSCLLIPASTQQTLHSFPSPHSCLLTPATLNACHSLLFPQFFPLILAPPLYLVSYIPAYNSCPLSPLPTHPYSLTSVSTCCPFILAPSHLSKYFFFPHSCLLTPEPTLFPSHSYPHTHILSLMFPHYQCTPAPITHDSLVVTSN